MSSTGNEFEQLMERVRSGDTEAAREIFDNYGPAIRMVVRRRLNRRMRIEFDSLDFTQDAWASFFHIVPERCTFETPADLVAFLSRIVRNKLTDAYRQRYQTAAHDRRKLRSLQPDVHDRPGRQPTPSQFAIADEEWDRMLQDKPPKLRHALEMLRAGHSRQEIAASLGLHPRRIQRLLQQLNDRYKRS
jgi:RNA polymerase sigma factor (sigma-70 family)